jgi:very-short-patch-repair endonuclease
VEAIQKAHKSEEVRKKHSDATKAFMAVPENLEARKKKLKETWAKPENRQKILELAIIGLKAANSPEGLKNRALANLRPEVKKKRSEIAKRNTYKRMINKDKYSKLNKFFEQKMNENNLYPEHEYPMGPYAVDFCFPENKLVIEADGDFWHANPEFLKERNKTFLYPFQKKTIALDKAKNTYLRNHGWKLC